MADIKTKYPLTSTTAITITLTSLATSATLVAGRESTSVHNTNDDLDHLIGGEVKLGTSPIADKVVAVYLVLPKRFTATDTPVWPDVFDGTDSAETVVSENVRDAALILLWSGLSDAVTGRVLAMPLTSIREACGHMPQEYGLFVVHDTGVNLDSTASNHVFHYQRVLAESV